MLILFAMNLVFQSERGGGERHKVHLLHGGIGKVHRGLLVIPKVKKERHQVLSERGDLLLAVFGKLSEKTFMNSVCFVTD